MKVSFYCPDGMSPMVWDSLIVKGWIPPIVWVSSIVESRITPTVWHCEGILVVVSGEMPRFHRVSTPVLPYSMTTLNT